MSNLRGTIKKYFSLFGIDYKKISKNISCWSIRRASSMFGYDSLVKTLREIVPDISNQEESEKNVFNEYWELKRRVLQAFQCKMMLESIKGLLQTQDSITVVDIGDSAGTHMLYLKELTQDIVEVNTISVNLDERAIEKIRGRGLPAILCRAEELDLGEKRIDLFTSFQMVEHLHNPALFFRRLAKKSSCEIMVMTVPFRRKSQVGLHHIRNNIIYKHYFAEDVHVFELSPDDWKLLFIHSGWKVINSKVYYQYPRKYPVLSCCLRYFWEKTDFEGFWGVILQKDTSISDLYMDWEE